MMVMVELILKKKKCKFLAKFKININIYLDFDMTFPVSNLIVSNFEALSKIMQMKKGISPWGLAVIF